MTKPKHKLSQGKSIGLIVLGLTGLGLTIAMLLTGTDVALFNPKGRIAQGQLNLIIFTIVLLLTAVVPTLIILYSFAWKYRESNKEAAYYPDARHSKLFVFSLWAIPSVFMLVLALVMWPATHKLEPKKPIAADAKPLTIQVIAMRWKWLFIYPEQNIATVNYVQVPVGTPVQFELSADEAPMSSFWIPHLGGQLYAMTGHVNRLNLIADQAGDYPGSSAEINGAGFAGMKFTARASSKEAFNQWVNNTRQSSVLLDTEEYKQLLKPSQNNEPAFYSTGGTDLYAKMLMKYAGSHDHQPAKYEGSGH
jgi:cytochrome o ubiquinol oxidase subunit II